MQRILLLLLPVVCVVSAFAQSSFPQSWEGKWKGKLAWHTKSSVNPRMIPMELTIQPAEKAGEWNWTMVYGDTAADTRPYILKPVDSADGRWVIDERNGIVLDQRYLAGRLSGAFAVSGNLIINTYYLENGKLVVEFTTVSAGPVGETGAGTEDSPKVGNHAMKGYQKAILERVR